MRNEYRQNGDTTDLALNKTDEVISGVILAVVIGLALAFIAVVELTA